MPRPGAAAVRPRIAIAQLRMHWSVADNMAAIRWALAQAHAQGAALCAFAELAITGFHRQIVTQADPLLVDPCVQELQQLAARLQLAVAVGAPRFAADAKYNTHLLIDEQGRLAAAVDKAGLTAPEATFFQPGTERPTAPLHGLRCTAVICREIEDHDSVLAQLQQQPALDLVFWPGQMRPDPAKPVQDPPEHVQQAQRLARSTGAFVVQTNWPNALNRPEESENAGRSACIAPDGELLFRLPEQGCGLAVFQLGQHRFDWHPQ
ncbi:MAG: carbon-nitrogen hydrolase family protein [Rubrivivax sp.]